MHQSSYPSVVKWSLGVGKKSSNAPIWGDYGRVPVGVTLLNQIYGYAKRLRDLEQSKPHSLVCLAFKEQVELNLAWYREISFMFQRTTSETFTTSSDISSQEQYNN